jgi:hypothetical protein
VSTPCEIASAACLRKSASVGSRECVSPLRAQHPPKSGPHASTQTRLRARTHKHLRASEGASGCPCRVELCRGRNEYASWHVACMLHVAWCTPAGMVHVAFLMHVAWCTPAGMLHGCTCDVTDRCRCMPLSPKSTCGTWCASTRAAVPGLVFVLLVRSVVRSVVCLFVCLFVCLLVGLLVCLPVLCFAALCARVFACACSLAFFPSLLPERVLCLFVCLLGFVRWRSDRPLRYECAVALRMRCSATTAP